MRTTSGGSAATAARAVAASGVSPRMSRADWAARSAQSGAVDDRVVIDEQHSAPADPLCRLASGRHRPFRGAGARAHASVAVCRLPVTGPPPSRRCAATTPSGRWALSAVPRRARTRRRGRRRVRAGGLESRAGCIHRPTSGPPVAPALWVRTRRRRRHDVEADRVVEFTGGRGRPAWRGRGDGRWRGHPAPCGGRPRRRSGGRRGRRRRSVQCVCRLPRRMRRGSGAARRPDRIRRDPGAQGADDTPGLVEVGAGRPLDLAQKGADGVGVGCLLASAGEEDDRGEAFGRGVSWMSRESRVRRRERPIHAGRQRVLCGGRWSPAWAATRERTSAARSMPSRARRPGRGRRRTRRRHR